MSLNLKLIIVGRRRPGTTLAEHRHHIRHVHGELVLRYVAEDPAHAPRRYVQNVVTDGLYRATPVGADPLALNRDFVTQIWFEDFPALTRSRETAFYRDQLHGDENNFVDQATVVFLPTREQERLLRSAPVPGDTKLLLLLKQEPAADAAAFDQATAALAAHVRGLDVSALRRHAHNRVLAGPAGAPPVDAVEEFWLADEASARQLLAALRTWLRDEPIARAGLAADLEVALLAQEEVLHAGPQPAPAAH